VEIIRSGDVIPHVKSVKSPSPSGPQMPPVKWQWNKTHVDAVLEDVEENPDMQKSVLLHFADKFGIAFCGEGTIIRLYAAGIKTIPDLLRLNKEAILKVEGFKEASAAKLAAAITEAKAKATRVEYAVGSGIFGRGVGVKKIEQAFKHVPSNLEASAQIVDNIAKTPGWSKEAAIAFVEHLPLFKKFMEHLGVAAAPSPVKVVVANENKRMAKEVILFTGFHPKELEEAAKAQGATIADTFTSKVTILVVKDDNVDNEKTKKAAAKGIPKFTGAQFLKILNE
jgi:NAD-dependent DNA ligase